MSYLVGAYRKKIDRSTPKLCLSDVPLAPFVGIRLAREIRQVDVDYFAQCIGKLRRLLFRCCPISNGCYKSP